MAALFMRLFFVIAIAAIAVAAGMWIGLNMVDGYKMEPRRAVVYVVAEEGGTIWQNPKY